MTALLEWLAYVERLHPRKWDLGLDRVYTVAEQLGLIEHRGIVFWLQVLTVRDLPASLLSDYVWQRDSP